MNNKTFMCYLFHLNTNTGGFDEQGSTITIVGSVMAFIVVIVIAAAIAIKIHLAKKKHVYTD